MLTSWRTRTRLGTRPGSEPPRTRSILLDRRPAHHLARAEKGREVLQRFLLVGLVAESGHQMIAEAPASYCDRRAKLLYRLEKATARRRTRSCARARVTGVAFFDFDHGQTGVAPNAIELHPILDFRCLTS